MLRASLWFFGIMILFRIDLRLLIINFFSMCLTASLGSSVISTTAYFFCTRHRCFSINDFWLWEQLFIFEVEPVLSWVFWFRLQRMIFFPRRCWIYHVRVIVHWFCWGDPDWFLIICCWMFVSCWVEYEVVKFDYSVIFISCFVSIN